MSTQEIYTQFNDRLSAFVMSKVKDNEATKDIVQDVFTKIHLKLPSLKDQTRLTPWVYQITRNTITDHFRKTGKSVPLEFELKDVEATAPAKDFSACALALINHLPERYKSAIVAVDIEGVSQTELADRLEIGYSSVKSRVQRARAQVKKGLEKCCKIATDGYGNIISDEPCVDECGC